MRVASKRRRSRLRPWATNILAIVVAVIMFLPIMWIFLASIKTQDDIYSIVPKFFFVPHFENYMLIFTDENFHIYLFNSLSVAGATTVLGVLLGSLAGYALSRFQFKAKENLAFFILSLRMMPGIAVVIPYFILLSRAALFDTQLGLVIVYLTFTLPLTVWLLKRFFDEIPIQLDEAARVDGYSHFKILTKIILPLSRTPLVVSAILSFIFVYSEFLMAFTLTFANAVTVPVRLAALAGAVNVQWNFVFASVVIVIVPLIILYAFLQRYFVKSLTLGAVKG